MVPLTVHHDVEFNPDDRLHAARAPRLGEPHGAAQVGVVGERQRVLAKRAGAIDQSLG